MFCYSTAAGVVLVWSLFLVLVCFSACCGFEMTHLEDYILMYKLYDLCDSESFPLLLQFSKPAGCCCKYLNFKLL